MAEGCPTLDLVDRYNSTPPAGAPAVRTPFIILFDGSAGSSWFAESLDRHPKVFIAGYEPLEWVRRPEGGCGAGAGAGADAFASESSVIVTGPSLTKCTCMSAPN